MARPALINRASVLSASLAIADQHGLAGVTMQAVAARLGVTPMALYRHVRNKGDLLDGVVESLLTEFPLPSSEQPWQQRLSEIARAIRVVARRHPDVFPLLLQRSANTPEARRVRDAVYSGLRDAGLPDEAVPRAERLLSTMVLGFAASEVGGRFSGRRRADLDADFAFLEHLVLDLVEKGCTDLATLGAPS